MNGDRAAYRNVYIYDASDNERLLGGLHQNGSVTDATFLDMLDLLLVTHFPIRIQDRFSCREVRRNERPLEPGIYDVYCRGPIKLSDEPWLPRLVSPQDSHPETTFSDSVRARDGKCVISGVADRSGVEAAHIFPRDNEDYWLAHDLARCITDAEGRAAAAKLSSAQNGLALLAHIRQLWDQYLISVNPDDNHKVVVFALDTDSLDGRTLDPACRDPADPHRASDALLRWHYRQAVLANVRGTGEPVFGDATSGTDVLSEIEHAPYAKERFQMEIAARLRGFGNDD